MLATATDINTFLPAGHIQAEDDEYTAEDLDAQRVIRGYLSGVFTPTILAGWASPETTPEVIRGVAGRLIAALIYSRAYSGEDPELNDYAQKLYNDAMALLQGIAAGMIIVLDPGTGLPVTDAHNASSADFWPNNTTLAPFFTMDQQF